MAFFTRHRLHVDVALAALLLANLLTDVGLLWLIEERFSRSAWLDQIPIGVILGQLMTLGLWLGLGDGRWYHRLVVVVPLTFGIAETIGIAELLTSRSHHDYDPGGPMMIAFIFLAMVLAVSLLGFVLRRTRGWRLTWQQITSSPVTSQFQVGDTLLWMIVLGGALAALRFLVTIDKDFPSQFLDIGLYGAKTTAVVLGAMLAAFTTRRRLSSLVLLSLFVVLIGAAFAVPDAWGNIQRMGTSATIPVTFYRYAVAWGQQTLKHEEFVIAAAVSGLVNCLALRALGCKLVRPTIIAPDNAAK
jgi:hypothetical protein